MFLDPARCEPLFHPKSIAVVGVSATQELTWGRIAIARLQSAGYDGELFAVGRPGLTLSGVTAVTSLGKIGAAPDLVVLATPADTVPALVREARALGAGAAVVFASGFAEVGADEAERELREAAGDMPLLGPNCLGVVTRHSGVHVSTTAFLDRDRVEPGAVGIVTQSGAIGFVLADLLERAGLGYAYYASVGNEACLGVPEIGAYLLAQPEVEVLVLYLEGVRDPEGLRDLGRRARAAGKAVVALAVGRSAEGRRAALSHTAAVAGDHLLLASLCRQEGIHLVTDDDRLVDAVLAARKRIALPPAPRIAVLTMSGGAGGLLADNLTGLGARVPELSASTRATLAELGVVEAADTNPVDLGGNLFRWMDRVGELLAVLDADPELDAVILYLTFGDAFPQAYRDLARMIGRMETPAWFIWACAPPGALDRLAMPETVVGSIGECLRRLAAVLPEPAPSSAEPRGMGRTQAVGTISTWSELRAAPVLEEAGVEHVATVSGRTAGELLKRVRAAGWPGPYVVKGDAADVPHRARAGVVRVGVSPAELPSAAATVEERLTAASRDPERRLVAQPLLAHTVEIALGAVRDQLYGTAVLLGVGGDRAEDPTAPRRGLLLPATEEQIGDLVRWAGGVLGAPTVATERTLRGLIGLLEREPAIAEVDVNPLCVLDDRLVAVDALITPENPENASKEQR